MRGYMQLSRSKSELVRLKPTQMWDEALKEMFTVRKDEVKAGTFKTH